MRRNRLALAIAVVAILSAALPAAATATVDDWQRVVRSRHAGATFVQVDGCDQLEVYISASDGKYVNRHGAVSKQGLLGVLLVVRDACATPGPKGFPIVASADAQSLDRLASTPRFDEARMVAELTGVDDAGQPVRFVVDLAWRPAAPFETSRVVGSGSFPEGEKRGARVTTVSHTMTAPAVAWGTIRIGNQVLALAPTSDATLQQVRYSCKVLQHPRGGADVDC